MKIAITAQEKGIDAEVDLRFGRAKYFILIDIATRAISYIDNVQNLQAIQGAGIQAAKTIIESGAGALVTGNVGPKAFTTLNSAGIDIYVGASGTVENAVESYINGDLEKTGSATVEGHS